MFSVENNGLLRTIYSVGRNAPSFHLYTFVSVLFQAKTSIFNTLGCTGMRAPFWWSRLLIPPVAVIGLFSNSKTVDVIHSVILWRVGVRTMRLVFTVLLSNITLPCKRTISRNIVDVFGQPNVSIVRAYHEFLFLNFNVSIPSFVKLMDFLQQLYFIHFTFLCLSFPQYFSKM